MLGERLEQGEGLRLDADDKGCGRVVDERLGLGVERGGEEGDEDAGKGEGREEVALLRVRVRVRVTLTLTREGEGRKDVALLRVRVRDRDRGLGVVFKLGLWLFGLG